MTKQFIYPCVLAGLLLVLPGCNGPEDNAAGDATSAENTAQYRSQTMGTQEFLQWCADEEHHLNKKRDVSEIRYNLMYMPPESMAYLELRTEAYDDSLFRKACTHYTALTYFKFRIDLPEGSGELLKHQLRSPQHYDQRVKYLAFGMERDLCLVQGNDTLRPGLYQFERIFEVAPQATVLLAFDNAKFDRNKQFSIVYNDRLFDKGYIKFSYTDQQLMNVPNITGL